MGSTGSIGDSVFKIINKEKKISKLIFSQQIKIIQKSVINLKNTNQITL